MASVDALATKVDIAEFAGGEAARCVFSSPGLELCGGGKVEALRVAAPPQAINRKGFHRPEGVSSAPVCRAGHRGR